MNVRLFHALIPALLLACDSGEDTAANLQLSISAADLGPEFTKVDVNVFASNKLDFSRSYAASEVSPAKTLTLLGPGAGGAAPSAGSLSPGTVQLNSASNVRIQVTASGSKGTVSKSHELSLPGSGTRLLQVILLPECAGVPCSLGQTCDKGASCVASQVDVNALPALDE